MNPALVPFDFHGTRVRAFLDENGNSWFAGIDVANIFEYAEPHKAIQAHCKHPKLLKRDEIPLLGIPSRGLLFIPESDVWRLLTRSKMPKAEEIEMWIMGEVLPTLRKTGSYTMPNAALFDSADLDGELSYAARFLPVVQKTQILTNATQIARQTGRMHELKSIYAGLCNMVAGNGVGMSAPERGIFDDVNVLKFAEECCALSPSLVEDSSVIHGRYSEWCEEKRIKPLKNDPFMRALCRACPNVFVSRRRNKEGISPQRPYFLRGIGLASSVATV